MNDKNEFETSAQPPQYPAAPRPAYFRIGKRERVYGLFLLLACLTVVDAYIWSGFGIAATLSTVFLALVSGGYLLRGGKRFTVYGCFCFLAFLACAISFTLSDNGALNLPILLLMILLAAVAMLERAELRQYPDGDFRSIADICYMVFALPFGKIGQVFHVLFHRGDAGEKRKIGSVLLGLIIALPVLLVIVPLLALSDAAFDALLNRWLSFDRLGELVGVLLLGFCLFVLLFGRLISLPRVKRAAPPQSMGSGLEPTVVISFLGAIAAVYVLYLFSQLSYFFNAFSGLLPKEFTVAEYARRGFFEMTFISTFNLGLIFLAHLICRKTDGRTPLAVRLLSLFLCIISMILSASVLSKLVLYIRSFGMTRLRVITFVFTVFLIAVLLGVALRLLIRKIPYMKIAVAAAAVVLLVCSYVGIDKAVAQYNVDAYLSGKLETIDMDVLDALSSEAIVEDLLRLTDAPDEEVANTAMQILSNRADLLFDYRYEADGAHIYAIRGDWRSWNLAKSEARDLLATHFDEYYINFDN